MNVYVAPKYLDLCQRMCVAHHGSRALDADFFAIRGDRVKRGPETTHSIAWKRFDVKTSRWVSLPHVTTSTDAALHYVPAHFTIHIEGRSDNFKAWQVHLVSARSPGIVQPRPHAATMASTLPLAICAAILGLPDA
jgi:hypothetical protein